MEIKDAVRLAILNIQKESITDVDVFARPFEVNYLAQEKNKKIIYDIVVERIKNALYKLNKGKEPFEALKELHLSPLRSILIPKKNLFEFRKCSYTEPIDEIIYLSLVLLIAPKIEKQRINSNKEIVFSYRLKKDLIEEIKPTYIFDFNFSYTPFRTSISKKAQKTGAKIVISCDISNFYDRLNLHRLENTLLALPGIDKNVVALINEMLLFWSNRDSYGLPVGSNASRILAEASLINVDKFMLGKNIEFIRFVDDFRIFTKDAKEAHTYLSILVERLNQEGLFLNTTKTKIASISEIKSDSKPEKSSDVAEKEKSELPLIIRGYSGIIPTKFRKLSDSEINNLKELEVQNIYNEKINKDLIDPVELQKYIRCLVAQQKWTELAQVSLILNRFPQFIPYYLDCISKNMESLNNNDKNLINNNIINLVQDSSLLEYLRVYIFRFLAKNEINKKFLLETYLNLRRGEGIYLGRALLEDLSQYLDRDDVLEIKKGFQRADASEKRIILRLMHHKLNKDEFNVFVKNISLTENDPWIQVIYNETIRNIK